jgi:AcrR family transcriptional regulator
MASRSSNAGDVPPKVWRGTVLEHRAAERREALLAAAIDIVGESGTAALTTESVGRRAGVIRRYLYESFASRDDLLRAAFERSIDELSSALTEGFDADPQAPMLERMRNSFRVGLQVFLEHPGVLRILFIESLADPVLRERGEQLQASLERVCDQFLLSALTQHKPDQPRITVWSMAIVAALVRITTAWSSGYLEHDNEGILDVAVDVVRRFLPPDMALESAFGDTSGQRDDSRYSITLDAAAAPDAAAPSECGPPRKSPARSI